MDLGLGLICDKWMASKLSTTIFDAPDGFASLTNDEDRFSFTKKLFQQSDLQLFIQEIGKKSLLSKDFRETGNRRFAEKKYKEANQLYTKSVAFAPKHSQERILALGNRAASSLHCGHIPEALVDVQRALEMTNIQEDYRYKLEKRKEECINRIIESKEPFKLSQVPEITNQNNFFECSSDKVVLKHSNEMGRFLSAADDIITGELLVVEVPYSCVLMPVMYYSHCSFCYLPYPALIECENCTSALYCSTQCLNSDKNSHKYLCNILERLTFFNIDQVSLLTMKILIDAGCRDDFRKLHCTVNGDGETLRYCSLDFKRCYELIGNTELRSPINLFKGSFLACAIIEALKSYSSFFTDFDISEKTAGGLALHFINSLPCNAHAIYNSCYNIDNDGIEVGAGAYAALSLINHSCDPNVVRQCVGSTSILRAIRPIKKGDELLDNYGYHYALHEIGERCASLKKNYYFECECTACTFNWPVYAQLPSKDPIFLKDTQAIKLQFISRTRRFLDTIKKVLAKKREEKMLDTFCEYLDFLDSNIQVPWRCFNDCQEAIKHCLEYFPSYQR